MAEHVNTAQREHLRQFFMRHPHPPWMHDERYFKRNGFDDEDDDDGMEEV